MKVKITPDMKKILTLAEMPAVNKVIECAREDTCLKDYAQTAARIASGVAALEILKAEAEIAKNRRIWDAYDEGTCDIDIWITAYAFDPYYGFYEIGAYLTDIWQYDGENAAELTRHMYIQAYTKK